MTAIKRVELYQASDGSLHDTEDEAVAHEFFNAFKEEVEEFVNNDIVERHPVFEEGADGAVLPAMRIASYLFERQDQLRKALGFEPKRPKGKPGPKPKGPFKRNPALISRSALELESRTLVVPPHVPKAEEGAAVEDDGVSWGDE